MEQTNSVQSPMFGLSDRLSVKIGTYLERSEHFTQMAVICKDANRLFSLKSYFSPATDKIMPHKWQLFEQDCDWWRNNEYWLLTDERKTIVLSEDNIIYHRSNGIMLSYIVSHFRQLVAMEKRYRYQMGYRHFRDEHCVFPPILSTIIITPSDYDSEPLSLKFAHWIGFKVLRNCEAQSPFQTLDLSNSRMEDNALIMISTAILKREHLMAVNEITLANNNAITDESMEFFFAALAMRCPKTKTVDLSGCHLSDKTVDIAIEYTLQHCDISQPLSLPNLIWQNTLITVKAVNRFVANIETAHSQLIALKFNTDNLIL